MNGKKKVDAQIWISFQATIINKFLFEIKNGGNHNTLRFGNEYLFSTLEKLQIQTKNNSNKITDYQQQSNSFLWLKSTLSTLSNQRTTMRLCYFCKGELKMTQQIHKNIYSYFVQRRWNNSKEKGSQTEIYWSQAAKFMNRTGKNESQKPKLHNA